MFNAKSTTNSNSDPKYRNAPSDDFLQVANNAKPMDDNAFLQMKQVSVMISHRCYHKWCWQTHNFSLFNMATFVLGNGLGRSDLANQD
jgi:hypothetical protein